MHANLSMKKTGRLAIGEVGTIKSACKAFGQSVRIVEEPEPGFPSHAAVRQFRDGDDELLQLLADEAWAEIVPV